MALANIVKSSLGPVGLDKMLVSNRKKMGAHKNLRKFLQFELAPPTRLSNVGSIFVFLSSILLLIIIIIIRFHYDFPYYINIYT